MKNNDTQTCDDQYKIGEHKESNEKDCYKKCLEDTDCNYFFISLDGVCVLYEGCGRKQTSKKTGLTAHKDICPDCPPGYTLCDSGLCDADGDCTCSDNSCVDKGTILECQDEYVDCNNGICDLHELCQCQTDCCMPIGAPLYCYDETGESCTSNCTANSVPCERNLF